MEEIMQCYGTTCEIPFTTTGLAFAVNHSYRKYCAYTKQFSKYCTIHQFYRYTLAQFEYQCFKLSFSPSPFFKCLNSSGFSKNFRTIVNIIDSYGRFTHGDCEFKTVAPPVHVHSPHTVHLTNLRAIVEKLSTNGDKDFVNENTLPGAIYNDDGVLQNPDDIIPSTYDDESLSSDAQAVQSAFYTLFFKYPGFFADCQFSNVGKPSTLVTTALKANGPYDSIRIVKSTASDEADSSVHSEYRDWYSIFPLDDGYSTMMMEHGILLYCGVWSEKLEAQWPVIKVRYPGSSKQLKYDASWFDALMHFENSLSRPESIGSTVVDGVTILPATSRVPLTTTGLSFAVNNQYARCRNESFPNYCTIHQLYRYTLVQFEFQCYIVGQNQDEANYYPYLDNFFVMYKKLDSSGMVKAYAKNFKSVVTIIDSFGYFNRAGCEFGTIPPPIDVHHPHTVRISNLRAIVEELTADGDNDFVRENTLPGAIYNADGTLLNADDIIPADYDDQMFLLDARAVRQALQILSREELWKDRLTSCKFSMKGNASTLVSTSSQSAWDSIPPIVGDDRERIRDCSVKSRQWYSIHSINHITTMKLGILSYCGVWSESLEKKWPDMKVRYPGSAKQLKTAKWSDEERFII